MVFVAALALASLTARLGLWQLDRAAQKTTAQAALDRQAALPPLGPTELADGEAALAQQVHRKVDLPGRWLPDFTVYLDNRPMAGRTGFFAVTPLLLDDGSAVLVQRGWLPRDQLDRTRIAAPPPPSGRVRVLGRLALGPSRLFEFEQTASGPIRQNLEVGALSRETRLRLRPGTVVMVDSTDAAGDGLKREWARPSLGVEKHQGYAAQWFALSALSVGLYVWFQIIRPRRAKRAGTTTTPSP